MRSGRDDQTIEGNGALFRHMEQSGLTVDALHIIHDDTHISLGSEDGP